jgi:retron-type reverse transcriptase
MSTDINRIAELAKQDPKRQFNSIAHLTTGEKLYEAFRGQRKDASAGIDGGVLRLIGKWIKVGVIEDGRLLVSETGTGQGQPISPLLALQRC